MEIKLRKWKESDIDSLVKYANNKNIAVNLTDMFPYPYKRKDAEKFITYANSDTPNHLFAIEINGEAVGSIGIHPQDDIHRLNAELGYWLAEPFWGKGIITNAVKQIVKYTFDHTDIERIFARPFGTNIASQKVLEKNKFRLEGRYEKTIIKNGELKDELIYAIRRIHLI
jgi:ribosomal-protein-alanine N-acetyltransferase